MKTLFFFYLLVGSAFNNTDMGFHTIRTPDNSSFRIAVISKEEADTLQRNYLGNNLEDSLLSLSQRPAYLIEGGRILYRQFHEGRGYIFPSLSDYLIGIKGESYFETTIIPGDNAADLHVGFGLKPAYANPFRKQISTEITEYDRFEGREFYLLKDSSVIILRERTPTLSDGYWYPSQKDFDFFYYVLSGKEPPGSKKG